MSPSLTKTAHNDFTRPNALLATPELDPLSPLQALAMRLGLKEPYEHPEAISDRR
jgi:hypothetical protein